MKKRVKVLKLFNNIFTVIIIVFSMLYLARNYENMVVPVLLGALLIVLPINADIDEIEAQKKINRTFNWIIYILVIIGFVFSLMYI